MVGGGGEEGRGEGDEEDVREKGKEVVKQGKDGRRVWRGVGFGGRGDGEERWRRGEGLERWCCHLGPSGDRARLLFSFRFAAEIESSRTCVRTAARSVGSPQLEPISPSVAAEMN